MTGYHPLNQIYRSMDSYYYYYYYYLIIIISSSSSSIIIVIIITVVYVNSCETAPQNHLYSSFQYLISSSLSSSSFLSTFFPLHSSYTNLAHPHVSILYPKPIQEITPASTKNQNAKYSLQTNFNSILIWQGFG